MTMSNYPNGFAGGLTVRNLPILSAYPNNIWWVHSAGQTTGDGTFQRPFTTLTQALARCVASRGDMIVAKAGHTESVTAAGALAFNVIGVHVLGLGRGRLRPKLTFSTSTAATLLVTAAQMTLDNFVLDLTGIDALAGPLAIQAADFSLLNCEVIGANATNQATLGMLTTSAADRLTIDGCSFLGTTDAGMTAAVRLVGGDGIQIRNNNFYGAYGSGNGAIENITTACTGIVIDNNRIINATAGSTKAITAVAGTTGMISNNRMGILSGLAPITAAGAYWEGNYYAAAVATAGTLV